MRRAPAVEAAAQAWALGMDGWDLLRTERTDDLLIKQAMLEHLAEIQATRDENLAVAVANALIKSGAVGGG